MPPDPLSLRERVRERVRERGITCTAQQWPA